MSGITPEIIERVRAETNIVDVIGDYVRLRRTGKNWLGLCPFHDDRNPSMNVEPVKGFFKCFSCGKGGDAITFLMELNGWTFPETVRNLAASLGIEITDDPEERSQMAQRERLAEVVTEAARFFNSTLRSDEGTVGLAYLRGRGLTDETITRYGLGYAPDAWDALHNTLREKGFTSDEIETAGLLVRNERGRVYDRFRGRTLFPIFSATGRVVGFGARRMSEDAAQPKYINTPETPLYHKSRVLYGLFQAKETIRKRGMALVVEGYLDVLSLHQNGLLAAVAPCGTALAPEHAELLSRYTQRVILTFDSDAAGSNATDRGIDVLLARGLDVAVARLPEGEDPDTFIRRYGTEEFERRLEEAVPFLDYRARQMKVAGEFDTPERQFGAIRSLVGSIAAIPDQLKRQLYIQKLAADFFLPEGTLYTELDRQRGEAASRERTVARRVETREAMQQGEETNEPEEEGSTALTVPAETALIRRLDPGPLPPEDETQLLRVITQGDAQLLEHIFMHISVEDFQHPLTRALLQRIVTSYGSGRPFTIDALLAEEMPPDLRDFTTAFAIERETTSDNWSRYGDDLGDPNPWRIARDCIRQIQFERAVREHRHTQETLASLQGAELIAALTRIRDLAAQINVLNRMRAGLPLPESPES